MTDSSVYVKKLNSLLKLNGIIVKSEFCASIIGALDDGRVDFEENFQQYVRIICECLEKFAANDKSIEKSHIDRAIEACLQSGVDVDDTKLCIISAFDFPIVKFDSYKKCYIIVPKSKSPLDAQSRINVFANRYKAVAERTKRNLRLKNFDLPKNEQLSVHTVDYLLSSSQQVLENQLVLGALLQNASGTYFLEDYTGMVKLNLKHTKYVGGFFYETCLVLVNGIYSDKVLDVSTMILPPCEEYLESKYVFHNINYFGGNSLTTLRQSQKLQRLMTENDGEMFVFISDLWLDSNEVFEKMEVLFQGLMEMPPVAFVFLGNFLSQSYGVEALQILQTAFTKLANIILKFDQIAKNSRFVFVPGTDDPGVTHFLPKSPLPKAITNNFTKLIKNATFTTNPCRIQCYTKEITVCRLDLLTKFMQQTFNQPHNEKLDDFIMRTILSQGHLSPFSLNSQPVHWNFDSCLYLYPLPDLIVVGDKCDSYMASYKGCTLVNPGSFIESNFSFKTYVPSKNLIEDCAL